MIKIGDKVTRLLGGVNGVPMELPVTDIKDGLIFCIDWKFDDITGLEVDEDIGWTRSRSGSYLKEILENRPELATATTDQLISELTRRNHGGYDNQVSLPNASDTVIALELIERIKNGTAQS